MRHDLVASHTIEVNAPVENVWRALTDPELIKEYLHGTRTETDWKVGSPISFSGEYNGMEYRDKGVIRELVPNRKLSYAYWSSFFGTEDKPENYAVVTCEVEPAGPQSSRLTWSMAGFDDEAKRDGTQKGMPDFLNILKSVAER